MLRALALVVLVVSSVAPPPPAASFQVVAHRANPASSLSRSELSAIFMKRTRSWPDGTEITPVEQRALRERFSRSIHGKSVAFVTRYWQRVIFAGRGVPPPELPNDAAMLEFVKNRRGAIGYIAGNTPPGDDVKVIAVRP